MSPDLYGAFVCALIAAAAIVYARHCRLRQQITAAMRRHPAGSAIEPVTVADSEWARWCDEAETVGNRSASLYDNETANKVAAILAHNEAERAWRDEAAVRRFMEDA